MDKNLFNDLLTSFNEALEIKKGIKKPSRIFKLEAKNVKNIREKTGLSQNEFAHMIHISVRTLQNWEQNKRKPSGAAGALLKIIENIPNKAKKILNKTA